LCQLAGNRTRTPTLFVTVGRGVFDCLLHGPHSGAHGDLPQALLDHGLTGLQLRQALPQGVTQHQSPLPSGTPSDTV
ncbi:hypothetical protein RSW84_31045, partial [Escherichia coli]|uniref:hypothetical protein n=1 Tax=Escherichia coli TaxID=562 RepID=UPI0028DF20B0